MSVADRIQIEPDGPGFCKTLSTIFVTLRHQDGITHWSRYLQATDSTEPRFQLAWSLIGGPFDPQFALAACIHDWYCEHTSDCYESRVIGDAVFFYLLRLAGVPKWKRTIMFLGVRLNSWWRYGRLRSEIPPPAYPVCVAPVGWLV